MQNTIPSALIRTVICLLTMGLVWPATAIADERTWTFDEPGHYTYDASLLEVKDGKARQHAFQATDASAIHYSKGVHTNTIWSVIMHWIELQWEETAGSYISRIFDAGKAVQWRQLSWVPYLPHGKPLPAYQQKELNYTDGNVDMTGNVMLLHFEDEAVGEGAIAHDFSGKNNHGTMHGNLQKVDGWLGKGINCGTTEAANFDYVIINPMQQHPTDTITVEMWVKNDAGATPNSGTPFSYSVGGHNNFMLFDYRNYSFYIQDKNMVTGVATSDGNWHHIAATWQALDGKANVYKDGDLVKELTFTDTIGKPLASGAFVLCQEQDAQGGLFDTTQAFRGSIDEVAIYNRVLTAEEVKARYARNTGNILFQVRTCADIACDGETFVGLDGINSYFSDTASAKRLSSIHEPPLFSLAHLPTAQFIQYQAFLTGKKDYASPALMGVILESALAPNSSWTMIQNTVGQPFVGLAGLSHTVTSGSVRYQISHNGKDWFYHAGVWAPVTLEDINGDTVAQLTNAVQDIGSLISSFVVEQKAGSFFFRAFILPSAEGAPGVLDAVSLSYAPPPADLPTLAFQLADPQAGEDTATVNLVAQLSTPTDKDVSFAIAATSGTAAGDGVDYTLGSPSMTIPAGKQTAIIPVTLHNDTIDEEDETITLMLFNVGNAGLGEQLFATITILDNDATPEAVPATPDPALAEALKKAQEAAAAAEAKAAEAMAKVDAINTGAAPILTETTTTASAGDTASLPASTSEPETGDEEDDAKTDDSDGHAASPVTVSSGCTLIP